MTPDTKTVSYLSTQAGSARPDSCPADSTEQRSGTDVQSAQQSAPGDFDEAGESHQDAPPSYDDTVNDRRPESYLAETDGRSGKTSAWSQDSKIPAFPKAISDAGSIILYDTLLQRRFKKTTDHLKDGVQNINVNDLSEVAENLSVLNGNAPELSRQGHDASTNVSHYRNDDLEKAYSFERDVDRIEPLRTYIESVLEECPMDRFTLPPAAQ